MINYILIGFVILVIGITIGVYWGCSVTEFYFLNKEKDDK